MPRVKGTQLAIQCLGDKFDAVYDVTIAYGSTRVTPQNSHSRNDAPSLSRKFITNLNLTNKYLVLSLDIFHTTICHFH